MPDPVHVSINKYSPSKYFKGDFYNFAFEIWLQIIYHGLWLLHDCCAYIGILVK